MVIKINFKEKESESGLSQERQSLISVSIKKVKNNQDVDIAKKYLDKIFLVQDA